MFNRLFEKLCIDKSKADWMKSGDPTINEILPKLSGKEKTYLEVISSEAYGSLISKLEHYTGVKSSKMGVPSVVELLYNSITKAMKIESTNKKKLEQFAVDLVINLDEFEMVRDAIEQGHLTIIASLKDVEIKVPTGEEQNGLGKDEQLNMNLTDELSGISELNIKSRFASLFYHGGAVLKSFSFHLIEDKLKDINDKLVNLYGVIASLTHLGYWLVPFGVEKAAVSSGSVAGAEKVEPVEEGYIIRAEAILFPFLVHEIVKGIYQWISIRPEFSEIIGKGVEDETTDLMIGPEIFKKIQSMIPAKKQKFFPLVQKHLLDLTAKDIGDVLSNNSNGKKIVDDILSTSENEWDEYTRASSVGESKLPTNEGVFDAITDNEVADRFIRTMREQGAVENNGVWSCKGSVSICGAGLTKIPVKFGKVGGNFYCSDNKLTSLKGAPLEVGGNFCCSDNKLTSLDGAPLEVGRHFCCSDNKLTSLDGAPLEVGRCFDCSNNELTSLKGAPQKVGGDFCCSNNELTSLKGAPLEVGRHFYCSDNKLTSLKGAPQKVGGDFYCFNNKLTSLKGAPQVDRSYLKENISEGVSLAKKRYLDSGKIKREVFDEIVGGDPSSSKKYVEWMVKSVVDGNNGVDNIIDIVKTFDDLSKKSIIKNIDIYQYTYNKLEDLVSKFKYKRSASSIEEEAKLGAVKVIDNDLVLVVDVKTHAASCLYGKHTKWCTAARDRKYWDRYWQRMTKLYYIIDKRGGRKYAVKVSRDGKRKVFDERDHIVSGDKFKSILSGLGIKESKVKVNEPKND